MKNAVISLACVLTLASCSFYQVQSVDDSSVVLAPAKKSFMDVDYVERVQTPHKVIGTLRVKTERNRGMEDVIRKMKMEAAVLGGDAVTEVMLDPEMFQKKDIDRGPRTDYIGKVIVYQN